MKIWIDGYEANVPQRLGSSQVAFEILRNVEQIDKENEYTILLPNPPMEDLPKERDGWRYQQIKIKRFKTYLGIPYALYSAKNKPDVIFSPTHYAPFFSPVPRVMMIFDLSFLHFRKMFKLRDFLQLNLWTKLSILGSKKIITISNFSKNDIVKNYQIDQRKVTVAYPGYNKDIFKPVKDLKRTEQLKSRYKIKGPYIIYIGTIQPRKNLVRLIEAFKDINDLKLVVVGKTKGLGRQAWMFEETLNAPKKYGVEEKVVFTGFVPTEELPYLLVGSQAYIQPSLWEGFGITVVEAMATGTPVIVSNVSSLPEVVGDAGIFIDPYSTSSMVEAIHSLKDDKYRQKKIQLGLKQAVKFSWQSCAQKVLKTVMEAVNER